MASARTINEWLTGHAAPIGSNKLALLVSTDGPGYVLFAHKSGQPLTGIPSQAQAIQVVTINHQSQYYAQARGITVPSNTPEGATTTLTATPYDASQVAGTPVDLTLTFHKYTPISGSVALADGNFVLTPADHTAPDKYWTVSMKAQKNSDGSAIQGAMARFSPHPPDNIQVWADDVTATTPLTPMGNYYYVETNAHGVATVRIATNPAIRNQFISCMVAMAGVEQITTADCYFANNADPAADGMWLAPYADTGVDGNIQIPASGGNTFNLNVYVNNESNREFVRYVVMNNAAAYPYAGTTDGVLPIPYSALIQDPSLGSNQFTYVRMDPNGGKIRCSYSWGAGVDGSSVNLPDPDNKPRVATPPLVIPDPGSSKTIALGTLSMYGGLRLALQDFPATALPGYITGSPLTVEFRCFMNGYQRNGEAKPSRVYKSTIDAARFDGPIPTVTVDSGTVKFSQDYVELSFSAAQGWGRNPSANENRKVGFEYVLSDGVQKWYSRYDPAYSWYWISTGNW